MKTFSFLSPTQSSLLLRYSLSAVKIPPIPPSLFLSCSLLSLASSSHEGARSLYMCEGIRMCTCMYKYVYVRVYVYVCICVYSYVYMYMYFLFINIYFLSANFSSPQPLHCTDHLPSEGVSCFRGFRPATANGAACSAACRL